MKYLPQKENYSSYCYVDCETDGLCPTKFWVMCASWFDSDEVITLVGDDAIKQWFSEQPKNTTYVGHNIISFDAFHLHRLLGIPISSGNCVDTLCESYLYDPAMAGGHSLEAWGRRLNDLKGSYNDWSAYTPEMATYCAQDVRLGKKVAKALWTRMIRMGYSELSCRIEHEVREVMDECERYGWYFDIPGAQSLAGQLRAEQEALEGPIKELFPSRLVPVNTYERRHLKNGQDTHHYLRHVEQYPKVVDNVEDGTYTVWDWQEFNIGSPVQRISRLLELGYEPTQFTPKTEKGGGGNPKVDEESLIAFAELSGRPEVKAIADWLVLQGRASMIETWLNNVNYDDSCIHGRVITCGATTRRMIANSPNTTNIPKAKDRVKYGKECRRLWKARPGRVQVGIDAAGLEMRMFAEYLDNDEATKLFTEGDPHMNNTRNLGLADEMRDLTVKNSFYA